MNLNTNQGIVRSGKGHLLSRILAVVKENDISDIMYVVVGYLRRFGSRERKDMNTKRRRKWRMRKEARRTPMSSWGLQQGLGTADLYSIKSHSAATAGQVSGPVHDFKLCSPRRSLFLTGFPV